MYANLTIQLSRELAAPFFRVWGAVYAAGTLLLWAWVFVRTLTLVRNGAIFESPCLEDFDMAHAAGKRMSASPVRMGCSASATASATTTATSKGQ